MVTTPQYRAGLFDGEGSVTVLFTRNGACKTWEAQLVPLLSMGNTDMALIRVMLEAYGGFVVTNKKLPRHKQSHTWTVRGSLRVRAALADMMPYLIGKFERAQVMMTMLETYNRRRGSNQMDQPSRDLRRRCFEKLRQLNRRGDP